MNQRIIYVPILSPLKVSWSTFMKVRKYYNRDSGESIPEVAAQPADETLYVNIEDRVNGGKMRVTWKVWLKVSAMSGIEVEEG